MSQGRDPVEEYLGSLAVELRARGVKCELVTTGCAPRLRLDIPWLGFGASEDSAFEDHVLAARDGDGQWRFWWPWIEPIGPVGDLAGVADYIYRNTTSLFDSDSESGGT